MPSPLPYLNLYHKEWLASSTVRMMPFAAQGIYLNLVFTQWEDEKLVSSPSDIKRLLRATDEEWAAFEPFLDACFPICEDGFRRNERVNNDRILALQKVEARRESGGMGGRPSKASNNQQGSKPKPKANQSDNQSETEPKANGKQTETKRLSKSKANGNQTESETKPIPEPDTEPYITPSNPPVGEVGVVENSGESWRKPTWAEFWAEFKKRYPKRGPGDSNNFPNAEQKVKAAWSRAKSPEALDEILQALDSLSAWASWKEANSPDWSRTYVPMAATWVNQRAKAGTWLDDERIAPTTRHSRPGTGGPRAIPKPVLGTDYELRYDAETEMSRRFVPGTDEPFVEAEWLKAQIGREAA